MCSLSAPVAALKGADAFFWDQENRLTAVANTAEPAILQIDIKRPKKTATGAPSRPLCSKPLD
jgi:hypothetical protein